MKHLQRPIKVLLLLLLLPAFVQSQTLRLMEPCGTWNPQAPVLTDWVTADTLIEKDSAALVRISKITQRAWIYDEWKTVNNSWYAITVYDPCGSGAPFIKEQYRVDILTGIKQRRTETISFVYVPYPRTPFEQAIDSLTAWRRKTWNGVPGIVYEDIGHGDTLMNQKVIVDTSLYRLPQGYDTIVVRHSGISLTGNPVTVATNGRVTSASIPVKYKVRHLYIIHGQKWFCWDHYAGQYVFTDTKGKWHFINDKPRKQ